MMQLLLYTAEKHSERLASLNELDVPLREKKITKLSCYPHRCSTAVSL